MIRRTHRLSVLSGAVLLAASACSKPEDHPAPAAQSPGAPASTEIVASTKPGQPLELVLAIKDQDVAADGSRVLQLHGTYKGADVGLIVALGAKWESVAPDPKSKFAFHSGTVEYRTIGAASDALVKALDEIYGTKLAPAGMRPSAKFACTSLQGDPADLAKGEVRLKLTLEAQPPAQAAELYTNIDLPRHLLRISEKDESFRAAIVRALAKE